MIVFGDRERRVAPAAALRAVDRRLAAVAGAEGAAAHLDAAVALLVDASAAAQGILDAEHAANGSDGDGGAARACHALVHAAARLVGGASSPEGRREVATAGAALARRDLPGEIATRDPEGFVHYALDPLAFARAGHALAREHGGPLVVVGLRTIGLALGAMVAAGAGDGAELVSVRPVGHPFRRELRVRDDLAIRVLAAVARGAAVAVVDEGPGLSGSSFGAALAWLGERGVPRDRVTLVPGHAGLPGPMATPAARELYASLPRRVVPFERMLPGLARALGAEGPLVDLSAGAWRARVDLGGAAPPPIDPVRERRKLLVPRADGPRIARFAGHGVHGERRLARAGVLASHGTVPPPDGLARGFLVAPWIEGRLARVRGEERPALLDVLARHLGAIATELPAEAGAGASLAALLAMAEGNAREALGEAAAEPLARWRERLGALAARERRVAVDGRLHAWEWIVDGSGRVWKTDALDHHDAHDLVGCQDLAWDLAGAEIELGLDEAERAELEDALVARSSFRSDAELLALHRVLYAAFHLGLCTLARDALRATDRAEAGRQARERARYEERFAAEIARVPRDGSGTRPAVRAPAPGRATSRPR